jgi:DNA-binding LytR/AlgR family response regulator
MMFETPEEFLFEAQDPLFLSRLDILFIEPDGRFQDTPQQVRNLGYDGQIVFLSHSLLPENIFKAFDVNSVNYLKKTEAAMCFKSTTEHPLACTCRFRAVCEQTLVAIEQSDREHFAVKSNGEYRNIKIKDILYFQGTPHHTVRVRYAHKEFYFNSSLKELADELPAQGFVRVHRSFIVSLAAIQVLDSSGVTLTSGEILPVSRNQYMDTKRALDEWHRTAHISLIGESTDE